jgi:hypothetical protein
MDLKNCVELLGDGMGHVTSFIGKYEQHRWLGREVSRVKFLTRGKTAEAEVKMSKFTPLDRSKLVQNSLAEATLDHLVE